MANVHVPLGIAGPNRGAHVAVVGGYAVGPGGPNGACATVRASALKVPV